MAPARPFVYLSRTRQFASQDRTLYDISTYYLTSDVVGSLLKEKQLDHVLSGPPSSEKLVVFSPSRVETFASRYSAVHHMPKMPIHKTDHDVIND